MLDSLKRGLSNLKTAFSLKYVFLAAALSFVFYLLNFFIASLSDILSYEGDLPARSLFMFSLFLGFKSTMFLSSWVSLIILSVLTGTLLSLMVYRYKSMKGDYKNYGFFGTIGIFLGVLAPGCVACGVGLAALFGLTASFVYLPLGGLEVSVFAIIILLFSILKTSSNLNVCSIPLNTNDSTSMAKDNSNSKNERRLSRK